VSLLLLVTTVSLFFLFFFSGLAKKMDKGGKKRRRRRRRRTYKEKLIGRLLRRGDMEEMVFSELFLRRMLRIREQMLNFSRRSMLRMQRELLSEGVLPEHEYVLVD
jgi:hypothetical protein